MRTKTSILRVLKKFSVPTLAKTVTKGKLRILCYHGFSCCDEYLWMPGVFMRPETFEARMYFLYTNGYPVLDLTEALELMDKDRLPDQATVITMDDGWVSIKERAHSICKKYNLPYTVYVSSYHSLKQSPVFNMFVRYLFWKTEKSSVPASGFVKRGNGRVDLADTDSRKVFIEDVIQYGQTELDDRGRTNLLTALADQLGVDEEEIRKKRIFDLMTAEEIKELHLDGVDIQLHTHRHHFPVEERTAKKEIIDNRAFLEPILSNAANHFCYPSGHYTKEQFGWLQELGILSATTIRAGFNDGNTNKLELNRFLDFDNYDQLIFEAEMCGMLELARTVKKKIFRLSPNENR